MKSKAGVKSTPNLKVQVIKKEREEGFRIPPCSGIPKYSADTDPYCPTGQMKKYNDEKRLNAKLLAQGDKRADKWSKMTIENNFEDVPLKMSMSLKNKALNERGNRGNKNALAEVEVLQKIVVREGLLDELRKLLKTQNEVSSCMGEVIELVKAIRYQTIDIVEDINAWQGAQKAPRPFLYRGLNYLVKVKGDLDFLDLYDEVVETFCFEFKSNPFAFRGGGNVVTGFEFDVKEYHKGLINVREDDLYVDGIEISRLHNAEKAIQGEFNRLAKGGKNYEDSGRDDEATVPPLYDAKVSNEPEIGGDKSGDSADLNGPHAVSVSDSSPTLQQSSNKKKKNKKLSKSVDKKASPIFNAKKMKLERIDHLQLDANELKAMLCHVEEKIKTLLEQHKELGKKKIAFEKKTKEYTRQDRTASAQHLAAETSVVQAQMQDINLQVKEMQREIYFLTLERKRKVGVMKKLKHEIEEEARKNDLRKKIEAKIKKDGLMSVLANFNGKNVSIADITIADNQASLSSLRKESEKSSSKTPTKLQRAKIIRGAEGRDEDTEPQTPRAAAERALEERKQVVLAKQRQKQLARMYEREASREVMQQKALQQKNVERIAEEACHNEFGVGLMKKMMHIGQNKPFVLNGCPSADIADDDDESDEEDEALDKELNAINSQQHELDAYINRRTIEDRFQEYREEMEHVDDDTQFNLNDYINEYNSQSDSDDEYEEETNTATGRSLEASNDISNIDTSIDNAEDDKGLEHRGNDMYISDNDNTPVMSEVPMTFSPDSRSLSPAGSNATFDTHGTHRSQGMTLGSVTPSHDGDSKTSATFDQDAPWINNLCQQGATEQEEEDEEEDDDDEDYDEEEDEEVEEDEEEEEDAPEQAATGDNPASTGVDGEDEEYPVGTGYSLAKARKSPRANPSE